MAGYLKENMTEADFLTWKIPSLKEFLRERGIILSGEKADLVQKAYFGFKLNLMKFRKIRKTRRIAA